MHTHVPVMKCLRDPPIEHVLSVLDIISLMVIVAVTCTFFSREPRTSARSKSALFF